MYENIILIPYRKRESHIKFFLDNSWKLIKEHLPKTKLVIIEQEEGNLFNRGKLLNVGFNEYIDKTEYFITNDVDINPNEKAIELYKKSSYDNNIIGIYCSPCITLGGIIKIKSCDIIKINGFPNNYWGWGVEDKALYNRAKYYGYNILFNIISRTNEAKTYFHIFDNINDRKKDNYFNSKTSFEYNDFYKLSNEKQLQHIMNSGLNNLEYTIIEKRKIEEDVEWIKVSI